MRSADRVAASPRAIAALLFLASATFVWWRNTQVGVLVDLAYVLNIATAVAHGVVPYRDFPLVNAPGEFLIQGLLIRVLGAHYSVQIAYASIAGGAATALAFLIARRMLAGIGPWPDGLAAIVALPLIPLGIYAILPNPFYDPDACLAVLATLALLLAARDRSSGARLAAAGAVATVALFIGQNIGGAFLVSLGGVLVIEVWARPARKRALLWVGLGAVAALAVETLLLQLVVGLDNFVRWTWTFALAGRGLALERIRDFAEPAVVSSAALVAVLAVATPRLPERARAVCAAAAVTVLVASLIPAAVAGPQLLFPPILIVAVVLGLVRAAREGPAFELLLPLVLLATALGTLESQGLSASSYGIYPLLSLALACAVRDLAALFPRPLGLAPGAGVVIAVVLTGLGMLSTLGNARLRFIDVNAPGPVTTSTFPSLAGLSARGPYLADLDAVLFWMREHVPPDEGFAFLPGEDPAFFALERTPALPSVYFFDVATPYTAAELARIADDVGLRWILVKDRLQLKVAHPLEAELEARLTAGATLVTQVGPYRVYRRG